MEKEPTTSFIGKLDTGLPVASIEQFRGSGSPLLHILTFIGSKVKYLTQNLP